MSFEELSGRLSSKLKGITRKLNWCAGAFNEEDLYQEAMIHLWDDYKRGKLCDKTDSYILQGCYFYLRNYIRKFKDKAQLISMDTFDSVKDDSELETIYYSKDARLYFDDQDRQTLVKKILNNGLSKREKEVLLLCSKDLTTREIGRILGISHVMVIKLRSRIKNKCREFRNFV